MKSEASRPPLAVAYRDGGMLGIAYLTGIAESLLDGGVPLTAAPAIGTSAGSWAAACVALDIRGRPP